MDEPLGWIQATMQQNTIVIEPFRVVTENKKHTL